MTPHLGANTFEAQVNVAIDVSREIINYLDDKPLENAVNIPRFDLALMDQMRPFLNLMSIMCDFGIQLVDTNMEKSPSPYAGNIAHYDCTPLTVCGLSALLNRMVDQDVNMVNATLIAEQMGIVVEETKSTHADAFSNVITLIIEGQGKRRLVSGTLFEGRRASSGCAIIHGFCPGEHMLLLDYGDRPGMIGKIGTIMGQHDINIASMNLGRSEKKGEAMVILSLDSAVPANVMEEIRTATEATFIKALQMRVGPVRAQLRLRHLDSHIHEISSYRPGLPAHRPAPVPLVRADVRSGLYRHLLYPADRNPTQTAPPDKGRRGRSGLLWRHGGRAGGTARLYPVLQSRLTILPNPLQIFAVWEGGMSFHGGFSGCHHGLSSLCPPEKHPISHADRHGSAMRTGGAGAGKDRQLHQRRTVRQADRSSLGYRISRRG